MSIRIDGTNTTANPGITGGDADTGLQFGTDEVKIVTTGGTASTNPHTVLELHHNNTGDFGAGIAFTSNRNGNETTATIGLNQASSGATNLYHNCTQGHFFQVNSSTKCRIDTDGLKFNNDSAAANALDDYEEGVWEPRFFNNANGAITVSTGSRAAKYVKIGRTVFITCYIQCSSKGTNTGNVTLDNLPYATDSNGQLHGALVVSFFSGMPASHSTLYATAQPSSNTILLRKVASTADSSVSTLVASQINNGFDLIVGGSYITAI